MSDRPPVDLAARRRALELSADRAIVVTVRLVAAADGDGDRETVVEYPRLRVPDTAWLARQLHLAALDVAQVERLDDGPPAEPEPGRGEVRAYPGPR